MNIHMCNMKKLILTFNFTMMLALIWKLQPSISGHMNYLRFAVEESAFINGNHFEMKQLHVSTQATAMLV
jgi:hypothetical protein